MSGGLNIEVEISSDKKFIIIKPPFLVINTSKILCIYSEENKKDNKFYLVIEVDIAGKNFKHSLPLNTERKVAQVIKEIFSKL